MTRRGREVLADQSPQLPGSGRRRRPYGPVVTRHHDASVRVDERHRRDVAVRVTLLGGGDGDPVGGRPADGTVVGGAVRALLLLLLAPALLQLKTLGVEPLGEAGLPLLRCCPVEARDGNV